MTTNNEMADDNVIGSWIGDDDQLRACCDQLAQSEFIAVDTEFMRTDTFYPKTALLQLADGNTCFLIDPLTIKNCSPLVKLLTDSSVTKVLHSCSEDLEVFSTWLNCIPAPLIDTQIAASLLNVGAAVGYANLINSISGVELAKEETRSNWLQRPLTPKQLRYATQDVQYLLPAFYALQKQLLEKNRWKWLVEECENLVETAKQPADPDAYYKRIKLAGHLSPEQLAILIPLSSWRETAAREQNKPRNHVVHEKSLVELARRQPTTNNELRQIEGLSPPKIRQYGELLLKSVADAEKIKGDDLPAPLPGPLSASQRQIVKVLKETTNDIADALQVSAEVLAKKSDYEHIVRSLCGSGGCELSDRMQGWRKAVVGDQLLSVANQHSREPPIIGINSEKINVRQICDIYKSSRDQELYVYVRFGAVLDDLPPDLLTRLGKPQKVMSITLTPERKLARVNVERVIQQVQEKGFYLQLPPSPFAPKTDD